MNAIFVVLLALIGISSVVADLSGFWSANDLNRLVKSSQKTLASPSSSSKDIYYSLQLLSVSQNTDSLCKCDAYGQRASAPVSLVEKFHAVKSIDLCSCNFQPSNELITQIEDSLQSDDFASLASAIILGKQFGKLTSSGQEAAFSKLREIVFTEGEISFPFSDAAGTLSKLHLLLDVLGAFKDDEGVQAFAADVFEKVFRLLPGGDGDILSDATLIYPLSSLSPKKLRIDKAALKVSAETLIGLKHSTDPEIAFKAYKSLDIIRTYKAAPCYASIKKSYFSTGEDVSFATEVYDVLGNVLTVDEVELVSLKVIGKDSFVVQNVKEKGADITVSADKLSTGRYGVNLAVNLAEKLTTIKFQTVVVVTEKVEIKEVSAGITDSKQFTSDLTAIPVQNSFFGLEVSASAQDILHVSFKISNIAKKPHQAFVRFANKETSESVVFVANKVGEGEYHLAIAAHEEIDAFSYESGEYVLSIMVADAVIVNQQEWTLGSVTFKFPAKPVVNLPLYAKSLLHTSDTTLKPLPEIEHQMRPPSKRASPFMSGLFTVLSILPLIVFVGFILSLKPNFARLNSLASIAFVICLVAIVALYSGYWLAVDGISFYDTIKYLCFLLPLTIVLGRYSLNSVATSRLSKEKQN